MAVAECRRRESDALRETISNLNAPDFPFVDDGFGIRLEWPEGEEKAALNAVIKWAWQVHDGVLFLPGVHRKREHLDCYYLRLPAHNGLLGTFFQFPTTIKKVKDPERKVVRFDEEKTFSVSYRRIAPMRYCLSTKLSPNKGICDDALASPMAAWIYPGSEPRFNNNTPPSIRRETGWRGPARLAYLMLFAPSPVTTSSCRAQTPPIGRTWFRAWKTCENISASSCAEIGSTSATGLSTVRSLD